MTNQQLKDLESRVKSLEGKISQNGLLKESSEKRITSVKEAQSRTRNIFAITCIVCTSILIGCYNEALSWARNFSLIFLQNSPDKLDGVDIAQRKAIEQWVTSTSITNSPLGINLNIGDAAIVGSFVLIILSWWFLFCIRRENHVIAALIRDFYSFTKEEKKALYEFISATSVFTTSSGKDDAIFSIEYFNQGGKKIFSGMELSEVDSIIRKFSNKQSFIKYSKLVFPIALFYPSITIFLVIVEDFYTFYFSTSPLRGSKPIYDTLKYLNDSTILNSSLFHFYSFIFIGIFMLITCFLINFKMLAFERANRSLLKELNQASEK